MSSVVFVHGTGVRYDSYAATFTKFQQGLFARRPETRLLVCPWGDMLGAPPLVDDGADTFCDLRSVSDPGQDDGGIGGRRSVLDVDPALELRALSIRWSERPVPRSMFGSRTGVQRLAQLVPVAVADPLLAEAADRAGVGGTLAATLDRFAASPLVTDCASRMANADGADWATLVDVLSEAVVAEAFAVVMPPSDQQYSPDKRSELAGLIRDLLQGRQLGIGSAILTGLGLAGTTVARRYREPLLRRRHAELGDILRYLAFGELVRRFVAETVLGAGEPVVLVGHSLGGIACLDLLARRPELPVRHLITVGSQGPQLHRMGALPGLPDGSDLPAGFPRWTNLHARDDLLSFTAEEVFGADRVRDVELRGGEPAQRVMPAAHSAYFVQPAFYELVAGACAASPPGLLDGTPA